MAPNTANRARNDSRYHSYVPLGRRTTRRTLTALVVGLGLLAATLVVAAPASAAPRRHTVAWTEHRIRTVVEHTINAERRAHGRRPLRIAFKLRTSAHRHNLDMAAWNQMSHQLPGEPYFATRFDQAGYHWYWAGENIGWNSSMTQAGVVELEKLMYTERPPNDEHRQNILSPHFRDVGVDVYFDEVHHKVWLTTDFGSR